LLSIILKKLFFPDAIFKETIYIRQFRIALPKKIRNLSPGSCVIIYEIEIASVSII